MTGASGELGVRLTPTQAGPREPRVRAPPSPSLPGTRGPCPAPRLAPSHLGRCLALWRRGVVPWHWEALTLAGSSPGGVGLLTSASRGKPGVGKGRHSAGPHGDRCRCSARAVTAARHHRRAGSGPVGTALCVYKLGDPQQGRAREAVAGPRAAPLTSVCAGRAVAPARPPAPGPSLGRFSWPHLRPSPPGFHCSVTGGLLPPGTLLTLSPCSAFEWPHHLATANSSSVKPGPSPIGGPLGLAPPLGPAAPEAPPSPRAAPLALSPAAPHRLLYLRTQHPFHR